MPTRFHKNRKKRGHVSAGHGRVGKHRCHPGGRGNAGGQHHHRILFDKFHPGYFGKIGMRQFRFTKSRDFMKALNVNQLWQLLGDEVLDQARNEKGEKAPVLDLTQHGYGKVLGKGEIPNLPIVVKARFFSKVAEEKIKSVGGACVLSG